MYIVCIYIQKVRKKMQQERKFYIYILRRTNEKACRLSISYLCLYLAIAMNGLCIFYCFPNAPKWILHTQSHSLFHSFIPFYSISLAPDTFIFYLTRWCLCWIPRIYWMDVAHLQCELNRFQNAWMGSNENRGRAYSRENLIIAYEMDISNVCKNRLHRCIDISVYIVSFIWRAVWRFIWPSSAFFLSFVYSLIFHLLSSLPFFQFSNFHGDTVCVCVCVCALFSRYFHYSIIIVTQATFGSVVIYT